MKHATTPVLLSLSTLALMALAPPAWAAHGGEGLQWGDVPPMLPKGAKLAILQGDPGKAGPFVMRLQLPKGYKVAPHSHSQTENVTVMSGSFMVGMGDKADPKAMKTMKPGAFRSIPAKANHYAMAQTPVILQIHGEGPFDLTYVDPKDDPQKAASKQ